MTVTITGGFEVPVESLGEASQWVREDISVRAVGSSEWCSQAGLVKKDGVAFAHISYNGRAWAGSDRTKVSVELGWI